MTKVCFFTSLLYSHLLHVFLLSFIPPWLATPPRHGRISIQCMVHLSICTYSGIAVESITAAQCKLCANTLCKLCANSLNPGLLLCRTHPSPHPAPEAAKDQFHCAWWSTGISLWELHHLRPFFHTPYPEQRVERSVRNFDGFLIAKRFSSLSHGTQYTTRKSRACVCDQVYEVAELFCRATPNYSRRSIYRREHCIARSRSNTDSRLARHDHTQGKQKRCVCTFLLRIRESISSLNCLKTGHGSLMAEYIIRSSSIVSAGSRLSMVHYGCICYDLYRQ